MQPAIDLKRKIQGPQLTLGVLISDHLWPGLIEIAAAAGLDYVIIDGEHFDHGAVAIADACRLGRAMNFPILYRPALTTTAAIRTAIDLGPCGLLLPAVESAAQLDGVRDGLYLPPRGKRRPGGPGNRWLSEFNSDAFRRTVEDHVIVIPQIETVAGLANLAEIARHPIVTALGVGPFDLSADLGVCFQPQHPRFRAAIDQVAAAAEHAEKPLWMIGDAPSLQRDGHRFLCIGEPSGILQNAIAAAVRQSRATEVAGGTVEEDVVEPAAPRHYAVGGVVNGSANGAARVGARNV